MHIWILTSTERHIKAYITIKTGMYIHTYIYDACEKVVDFYVFVQELTTRQIDFRIVEFKDVKIPNLLNGDKGPCNAGLMTKSGLMRGHCMSVEPPCEYDGQLWANAPAAAEKVAESDGEIGSGSSSNLSGLVNDACMPAFRAAAFGVRYTTI